MNAIIWICLVCTKLLKLNRDMGKTMLLIIIAFFSLLSCQKKESEKKSSYYYDYEVLYNFQGKENIKDDRYRFKFSSDSLHIFVESGFENDTIEVKIDNNIIVKDIVSTDGSTGLAKYFVFRNLNEIESFKIRFNRGPWIVLGMLDDNHNLVGVKKQNERIQVVFYKKVPLYY